MTITTKIHDLKTSGAFNANKYLDGLLGSRKTDPAVFVVPLEIASTYAAQKFKGNVYKTPLDTTPFFDQWVIGI